MTYLSFIQSISTKLEIWNACFSFFKGYVYELEKKQIVAITDAKIKWRSIQLNKFIADSAASNKW